MSGVLITYSNTRFIQVFHRAFDDISRPSSANGKIVSQIQYVFSTVGEVRSLNQVKLKHTSWWISSQIEMGKTTSKNTGSSNVFVST